MRAAVVGLVALLLCGSSDGAPKKHAAARKGTVAAYIDPHAPPDPPRPAPRKPERASILFLIDRTMLVDEPYGAWDAAYEVGRQILEEDLVAVMAFDRVAEVVVKPVWPDDYRRVVRAVDTLKPVRGPSDLASALDKARNYIAPAPGRKLVVLVTNKARFDDNLEAALVALRTDSVELVVVGTMSADTVTLARVANAAGGTFTRFDQDHDIPTKLEAVVRALHNR